MRPPLRLVPTAAPRGRRIAVVGELDAASAESRLAHAFHSSTEILPCTGTAGILALELGAEDLRIELDVDGSVQRDGLVTVTSEVRLRHAEPAPPGDDPPGSDAETTALAAGAVGRISLRCSDEHGCTVSVTGSITHGPPEEDGGGC